MSFDKKEFLETVAKRSQERNSGNMPLFRAAVAVAPIMEKLMTGSDVWDRYLQHLQAYINQAETSKLNAQAKISDPAIWDAGALAKLKSDILIAEAMIQAWRVAMQLPKALIQGGEEAQAILSNSTVEQPGSSSDS